MGGHISDKYDATSTANPIGSAQSGQAEAYDDQSLLDLIQEDPKRAAELVLRQWDESTTLLKPHFAQWKINRARMAGYTGMRLVKVQNEQRAFFPLGSTPSQTTTNKAARLCRRLRSTIFADPAVPDAIPSSDDDEDRDAADMSTRVLTDVCGNHNLAYNLVLGDAFDLASTHGSGFVRFWIDPAGGGKDEKTGEWLPQVRRELLTRRNVRLIPDTASDVWDARGVMIGALTPLSELKRQFPKQFAKLREEDVSKLVGFRPQASDELLPVGRKDRRRNDASGDALVFVLTIIHLQDAVQYPEGCYAILAGGEEWLHSGPWMDPKRGTALDLPLTEVFQIRDEECPRGMMEFLGPGNEVRQSLEAAIDEHLRRFTQRKTFVPIHSNLQPEQLQAETRTYIPIVPNGAPVNEEVPDFPKPIMESYEMITREMDDESGLQEAGQGLTTPSVKSGTHATRIIAQVNVGLSTMAEYSARAIERGWEIILQQIRAFVDTELMLRWQSEGGEYKVRRWNVSDLGGTTDVRIQKGSFTQLSSMHKAETVSVYMQQQLITPMEGQRLIMGQVGSLVGLQDNPYRQRVRRQIALWEEGPPEDWMPTPTAPQVDPATGQLVPGQPQPDPMALQIFTPLPVDEQPDVAQIRAYELGRALSDVKAERRPKEWTLALVMAYEQARIAAGIQTVADQQRAMAQQQQMQQEQQMMAQQEQQGQQDFTAQVGQALEGFAQQLQGVGQVAQQTAAQLQETHQTVEQLGTQTATTVAGMQRELDTVKAVALAKGNGGGAPVHLNVGEAVGQILPQVVDTAVQNVAGPVGQALQTVGTAVESVGVALGQLQEEMAKKPREFRVVKDKSGKVVGAEAVEPEA